MTGFKIKRTTKQFSIEFPTNRFLWRRSGADELMKLDTLLEGGLYMARLDRFNDPREGALGRKTKSLLDKAPPYARSKQVTDRTITFGEFRGQEFRGVSWTDGPDTFRNACRLNFCESGSFCLSTKLRFPEPAA
jgi:hypothetical protein